MERRELHLSQFKERKMKLKQLESYLGDVVQFANPKVSSSSSSSSYLSLCSSFGVLLRS